MKRYELGSAIFLFALGIFVCLEALTLDMGRIVKPGPGFFPFWLGVSLTIVSLALAITFHRKKIDSSDPSLTLWKGRKWEKVLFSLVALLLYALFLESLGYILATLFLLFFLFWAIEAQRWPVVILGSAAASLVTYVIFKLWLQVQLPVGIWGL